MKHLVIQQKRNEEGGQIEIVNSAVITALYNLSKDEQLIYDANDLKGDLQCDATYQKYIDHLHSKYPNLNITSNSLYAYFEDSEVESICVDTWGNGNDGLTIETLGAVTTIPKNTFRQKTNIISGNDLSYFTGLIGKGGSLDMSGCTNMVSLTIPPRITEMFNVQDCTSLTTIEGLDHISKVLNSCFKNCSSLESLVFTNLSGPCELGEKLTQLSNLSLNEGCTELKMSGDNQVMTSLYVPASVTNYNVVRFKSLTTVTFAENSNLLNTNNYGGFCECKSLVSIINFPWDTWTTMGSYCFDQCQSLTGTIKTPRGQTNIPPYCFRTLNSIDKIVVDSAVNNIENSNFDWCKTGTKVIMNPTTPPTLSHSVQGDRYGSPKTSGCIFYVPDSSYNDYISNGGQYWTELYNNGRIKKQSELPS